GSSAVRFAAPDFGSMARGIYTSVVWDPAASPPNNFFHPQTLFAPNGRPSIFSAVQTPSWGMVASYRPAAQAITTRLPDGTTRRFLISMPGSGLSSPQWLTGVGIPV